MIAELYASMCGGAELWNRARTYRYVTNGVAPPRMELRCAPCDGLQDLIPCVEDAAPEPNGYNLPELDPAPWYDPLAPESKDFAGFFVLETRLSPAVDRRMVQAVGHGAVLTVPRLQGRTLEVRGLLIGRTCCAVDYGLRWLTQALLGNDCLGCEGCGLTFLTCTPHSIEGTECMTVFEGDQQVPYYRDPESSEWVRGLDFVRQMFDTGLLQGPEIISMRGTGCGGCGCAAITEVEFTIGIGNPWMYASEELIADAAVLGGCSTDECMVQFEDGGDCTKIGGLCADIADCEQDPDCGSEPPPAGSAPLLQCGCLPLAVGRNCFAIPSAREWFDQAITVEVSAGTSDLRNVAFRLWHNPLGMDCCSQENETYFPDCASCATLLIGYVPAGGILRFDSMTRKVTVTCNGQERPADRNVATVEGLPFDWLEAGCNDVCLSVTIDCANTGVDATVSVWRATREL